MRSWRFRLPCDENSRLHFLQDTVFCVPLCVRAWVEGSVIAASIASASSIITCLLFPYGCGIGNDQAATQVGS